MSITRIGTGTEPVPRTTYYPAKKWSFVPRQVKSLHAVGRTSRVRSLISQEEVDKLVEEYGSAWPTDNASITMQLDFIATEILRKDRLANTPNAHSARKDYLSLNQWWGRAKREIPFADIEHLVEMMEDPKFRSHFYPERITDRPYDKQGNHHGVFTQPARRVEEASHG